MQVTQRNTAFNNLVHNAFLFKKWTSPQDGEHLKSVVTKSLTTRH